MNWIHASILLLISSVFTYLFIRKAKEHKISVQVQNLAMFFPSMFIFYFYNLVRDISLSISPQQFAIILGVSLFFSWLGNKASLKALEVSPNPGYSLIISKSYVVMTSILSTKLFDSPLSDTDILSIIIIVLFSALVIIEKKERNKKYDFQWIPLTFCAFFAWGFLSLTLRYLTDQDIESTVILFYLDLFVSVLIIGEIIIRKMKIKFDKTKLFTFLAIGLASTFFNLFMVIGYKLAPNPGYINAVNAGSISVVTLFSSLLFKDELNLKKIIGVIGVVIGLILLFVA